MSTRPVGRLRWVASRATRLKLGFQGAMTEPGALPVDEVEVVFDTSEEPKRVKMAVLTMPSPVFERMLSHEMQEKKRRRIELPGKDPEQFNTLISFLTPGTGRLQKIDEENVEPLLAWSDEYGIDSLRDECLEFIKNHMNKKPSPKMVELAFAYKHVPSMHQLNLISSIFQLFNQMNYDWGPECKDPQLVRHVFREYINFVVETFLK